jgi:hypothetical protein
MARQRFIQVIGSTEWLFAPPRDAVFHRPARNLLVPLAGDEEYAHNWRFSGLSSIQRTKQPKLTSN